MSEINEFQAYAFESMAAAVDPEKFIFMARVFDAAGREAMPLPSTGQLAPLDASTLALFRHADHRFNQAMLTVANELIAMNEPNVPAYLARLAMLPDLYNVAAPIFDEFLSDDVSAPGTVSVSPALMKAAAIGTVHAGRDGIGFDLGDVLEQARRFAGKHAGSTVAQ